MEVATLDEKLACLRSIGIFGATPPDVLARVAGALTPLCLGAGEQLFAKGDPGDSLYVIAAGRVRVHDGDLVLNYLDQGDVVGELAVLDSEPRSAAVTADADTRLFRLDQAQLYELMADQIAVARGVMHILCGHLRARIADRTRDYAYIRQVAQITAAAQALESGAYVPSSLDEASQRNDALGDLARVFQHMAREVHTREQLLKRQVAELRIEIDRARQTRQVAEITSSDYFLTLRQRAQALRSELGADEEGAERAV